MVMVVYERISNPAGLGTTAPPGISLRWDLSEWYDRDDATFVGLADLAGSFATLDAAALLARAQSIHARHPITDPETGEPYTDDALEDAVTAWIAAAGA